MYSMATDGGFLPVDFVRFICYSKQMKICSKCKQTKELDQFYRTSRKVYTSKNQFHSCCKICHTENQINRWYEKKKKAVAYKGNKCMVCGYHKNYASLDFHHRDPGLKTYDWTSMKLRPWPEILIELDKCDLLCRNCHNEYHYPNQEIKC